MKKKTLVLGASENPERYAHRAIQMLKRYHHPVVAIGLKEGQIGDTTIHKADYTEDGIDTVTMYVGPKNQSIYYDYILGLKPQRIIFNPGAENPELAKKASEKGIETIEACTLVMLSSGQY